MTKAYRYGRFAARIRYAAGEGVISSFFLWKDGSEVSGTYWNELDFEKMHSDCRMQTNTLYGNPVMGKEQVHTMPADMCDAYHDYVFEWTPTYIAWFIDKTEIRRETGAAATAFADNAPAGMQIHFNVWPGDASFGGNFDPKILPVRQYISWVEYSSFKDGAFNFEWREEFNGGGVPSGWAVGSWASPKNLSTHNAQNVTFTQGVAVLSLTSDQGTGFTGSPPADGQAGSSNGGAPGSGGASMGGAAGMNGGGKGGSEPSAGTNNGGGTSGAAGMNGGAGATSGAAGNGGASNGGASAGGVGAGNGGTAPAGGSGSGGAPIGSGGMTSSGGIGSPVSSGGAPSAGGVHAGSSGSGGASAGSSASGAAGNSSPAAGDDGGGCALVGAPKRDLSALSVAVLALAALRRRRAR